MPGEIGLNARLGEEYLPKRGLNTRKPEEEEIYGGRPGEERRLPKENGA